MITHRKKNELLTNSQGFTIIETLVAIVILVIGIFTLYSLHVTSIRYNASANAISSSSTWAADRIERILALDFDDPILTDANRLGTAGLDDTDVAPNSADGTAASPDGRYTIFWNVAAFITPDPSDTNAATVKKIRIIVRHNEFGINKNVVLDYYKQKLF
jgi:type IV pilus assembly protein PilV